MNVMKCMRLGMSLYHMNEKVYRVEVLVAYDKTSCPPRGKVLGREDGLESCFA